MIRRGALTLAALLLAAPRAVAQPLYERPPVGRLERVRTTYDPEVLAALDASGRALTRNRMSGELRCYEPGAGPGDGRILTSTTGALAVSEDQRTFLALTGSTGDDTLRFSVLRCDGMPPREPIVYAAGQRLVNRTGRGTFLASSPSGLAYFVGEDALWRFDPQSTATPVAPQRRLAWTELDTALQPERFAPLQPLLRSPAPTGHWTMHALTFGPSGRLFALVEKAWTSPGRDLAAKWVVEIPETGAVRRVAGPFDASLYPAPGPRPMAPSLLTDATTLVWVQSLGMLAAQTTRMEPVSWTEPEALVGTGIGLALVRPEDGASGYLSLSELYADNSRCMAGAPGSQLRCMTSAFSVAADGSLLWTLDGATEALQQPFVTYRLRLDANLFDLDGDRVRAGDEMRAGSSDLRVDSDGAGATDAVELLVGTNPADPADDARAGVNTPRDQLFFTTSSFVRSRWSERGFLGNGQTPATPGRDGALCNSDGSCYDRFGAPVGGFVPAVTNARSVDGRAVVTDTADALVRTDIATGRRETVVTASALGAVLRTPLRSVQVLPVDDDETWVWTPDEGKLVLVRRGRAPELRFDHAAARCASGLCAGRVPASRCTGVECAILRLPNHDVYPAATLAGYLAERREVVLSVSGNWESYAVGVGATTAPRVLARMHAAFLPTMLQPIAPGRYLTSGTRPFAPFNNTVVDAWMRPIPSGGSTLPFSQLRSAFGDTHLHAVCCGTREDGLWEVIATDSAVRPGDGVMLLGRDDGAHLWKLPRRGGAVEVQVLRDLRAPTGLDVHRDGRVCVADPRLRKVVELLPDGDGGGYVVAPRELLDVQAVDCLYGDDGAIHALVRDNPSRVVVWSPDRARFTTRDAGAAGDGAWQFDLRGPDNYFVTAPEGAGVPHHASVRVRVDPATARLMVDNEPVGAALTDVRIPTHPTRFHVALRDDGYALVLPAFVYNQETDLGTYRIQVLRLRDGDLQEFARWGREMGFSAAMGVRPGGPTTNPWTDLHDGARTPSATLPAPPPRLAGGTRDATAPRGCATTPTRSRSGAPLWVIAAALAALLRRGRPTRGVGVVAPSVMTA